MKCLPEFRQPLFVGLVLLYLIYNVNKRLLHYPLPSLVTSYFADVAAMPVLLTLALTAQRRLLPGARQFVLPDSWLVVSWLFVSFVFEGLLPYYVAQAVADPLDVAAYAIGTWTFRRWLNSPVRFLPW